MSSRILTFAFAATTLLACGKSDSGPSTDTVDAPDITPPTVGFQIVSPDVTIPAGEEHTFCYFFQTPNTDPLVIKKWASHMSDGSHHLIVYFTAGPNANHAPGSAPSESDCGGGISDAWTYSAQNIDQEMMLPTDDGTGKPLGMEVPAGQYGYVQMHYNNKGDTAIQAHVTVNGEGYAAGTAYTPTAAYVTYLYGFTIPAANNTPQNPYVLSNMCNVPAGRKFWLMSTHAHHLAVETQVNDGATMKFQSTDWEHPGAAVWNPDFYTFSSGKLTNSCQWVNTTGGPVSEGQSARTNEMCMAAGYQFPATKATFCVNGQSL